MNTIQLECFVSVAEHLNFSKASRVLKITQPAVSHQIQSLEEELNVKLFTRTSKSVALTQEGLLFLPDVRLILRTAFSAKELAELLNRFLGALDRENRVIFLRRYWYADSVSAIAIRLRMSDNQVSVRLHRIRKKLKAYLRKEGVPV